MFSLTCGIFPLKIYNWNVNQGFLGGGYQQERGKEMVKGMNMPQELYAHV
jgi:hypothetical protein